MDTLHRLLRDINYNFALYAVAASAMLYVVASQPVIDAVLNFCLAGIVPFSDKVIEPDVMFMAAMIALGLFIVFLLIWLLVSRARNRQLVPIVSYKLRHARTARSQKLATKATSSKKYLAVTTPKLGRRASTSAVDYDIFDKTLVALGNGWLRIGDMLHSLALGISNFVVWIVGGVVSVLIELAVAVCTAVNKMAIVLAPEVRALISWLHPRARQFDGWLEIKSKSLLQWLSKKVMRYERIQILAVIIRDGKVTLRHLFK